MQPIRFFPPIIDLFDLFNQSEYMFIFKEQQQKKIYIYSIFMLFNVKCE